MVYFYKYNEPDVDTRAKQNVISKLLVELKDEYGDEILLIPIAADNNLTSVNLILDNYDIKEEELPVIFFYCPYPIIVYHRDDRDIYPYPADTLSVC